MFLKKILCFLVGHSWKDVAVMLHENNDKYFYVGNYIKYQLKTHETVNAHQCKRCNSYILKIESPEYC